MERYDKLITEIQELIATEEREIGFLRQHTSGIASSVAISIHEMFVGRLKEMLE